MSKTELEKFPCCSYLIENLGTSQGAKQYAFANAYISFLEKSGVTEPSVIEGELRKLTLLSQFSHETRKEPLNLLTVGKTTYPLTDHASFISYRDALASSSGKSAYTLCAMYEKRDKQHYSCYMCPYSTMYTLHRAEDELSLAKWLLSDMEHFTYLKEIPLETLFVSRVFLKDMLPGIQTPHTFPYLYILLSTVYAKLLSYFSGNFLFDPYYAIQDSFQKGLASYRIQITTCNNKGDYDSLLYHAILDKINHASMGSLELLEKLQKLPAYTPPFEMGELPLYLASSKKKTSCRAKTKNIRPSSIAEELDSFVKGGNPAKKGTDNPLTYTPDSPLNYTPIYTPNSEPNSTPDSEPNDTSGFFEKQEETECIKDSDVDIVNKDGEVISPAVLPLLEAYEEEYLSFDMDGVEDIIGDDDWEDEEAETEPSFGKEENTLYENVTPALPVLPILKTTKDEQTPEALLEPTNASCFVEQSENTTATVASKPENYVIGCREECPELSAILELQMYYDSFFSYLQNTPCLVIPIQLEAGFLLYFFLHEKAYYWRLEAGAAIDERLLKILRKRDRLYTTRPYALYGVCKYFGYSVRDIKGINTPFLPSLDAEVDYYKKHMAEAYDSPLFKAYGYSLYMERFFKNRKGILLQSFTKEALLPFPYISTPYVEFNTPGCIVSIYFEPVIEPEVATSFHQMALSELSRKGRFDTLELGVLGQSDTTLTLFIGDSCYEYIQTYLPSIYLRYAMDLSVSNIHLRFHKMT